MVASGGGAVRSAEPTCGAGSGSGAGVGVAQRRWAWAGTSRIVETLVEWRRGSAGMQGDLVVLLCCRELICPAVSCSGSASSRQLCIWGDCWLRIPEGPPWTVVYCFLGMAPRLLMSVLYLSTYLGLSRCFTRAGIPLHRGVSRVNHNANRRGQVALESANPRKSKSVRRNDDATLHEIRARGK